MPQPASAQIEEGVLDVLKNVSRRPIEPTLGSELVADLGFDSLQVLEVIAELEDRFDISIPLNDVPATRTVGQVVAQVARLVDGRTAVAMGGLRTLPQALEQAAQSSEGYTFVVDGRECRCTYAELQQSAFRVARALQDAGLKRGDLVALVVPDAEQFLTTLFGASLAGLIPASLYPPATAGELSRYFELTGGILRAARRARRDHLGTSVARV